MPYDTSSDPYIDPKLGVLYNKLGAKTQKSSTLLRRRLLILLYLHWSMG